MLSVVVSTTTPFMNISWTEEPNEAINNLHNKEGPLKAERSNRLQGHKVDPPAEATRDVHQTRAQFQLS